MILINCSYNSLELPSTANPCGTRVTTFLDQATLDPHLLLFDRSAPKGEINRDPTRIPGIFVDNAAIRPGEERTRRLDRQSHRNLYRDVRAGR